MNAFKYFLILLISFVGFVSVQKKLNTELGFTYESLFRVLGKPNKTIDRAITRFSDVTLDDQKRLGELLAAYYDEHDQYFRDQHLSDLLSDIVAVHNPKNFKWNVFVEDFSPNHLNAHAEPGGVIVISKRALEVLDDGELIALLSHEVGHIVLGHCIDSYRTAALKSRTSDNVHEFDFSLRAIISWLHSVTYSKQQEREADEYSLKSLQSLGISPKAAYDLFQKFEDEMTIARSREIFSDYFKTHPDIKLRKEFFKSKF